VFNVVRRHSASFGDDGFRGARTQTNMRSTSLLSLVLFSACLDRPVAEVITEPDNTETTTIPTAIERDVDILFVIDSSMSMSEEHTALRTDFGTLLDRLDDFEEGMPNVHIGVVSSDLGTAPYDLPAASCDAVGGDGGRLQGSTCTQLGGNRFLSDVLDIDGVTRLRNYTGTIEQAFGCMSDVGSDGCGFEQHLEAMKRALSPTTNPGFVRDHAALAVIFIADEDDCSASNAQLYNPTGAGLGPLTDFRCHAQGIICDNDPDPSAPGIKTGCRPDPDSPYLQRTQAYFDFLVDLKGGNPRKVAVAGIIGNPDEVTIGRDALDRPTVVAGCPAGGLGASEPGIRFDEFLSQFEYHSTSTLCAGDLRVALEEVGNLLQIIGGSTCLLNPADDRNPNIEGLQPECSLTQDVAGVKTVIPMCGAPGVTTPCWRIVEDDQCSGTNQRVQIERGGEEAPDDGTIAVQCVVE
jgi:hypothetical protein